MSYTYRIGNIKVEAHNINEAKELAEQLGELSKEAGMDLPKHLNDFCFAIDVDYQNYYDLDEDDWSVVQENVNKCYLCKETEDQVTKLEVEGDRFVCDNCIVNR